MPQVICEMWNCWACSKHNVTADFASNSTVTLKSQNVRVFFHLTSSKFITKSKNVADKKICGWAVALKTPRKLICDSWFCNVVGCETQISIELGCSPGRFTWKVEGEQCCKIRLVKVNN